MGFRAGTACFCFYRFCWRGDSSLLWGYSCGRRASHLAEKFPATSGSGALPLLRQFGRSGLTSFSSRSPKKAGCLLSSHSCPHRPRHSLCPAQGMGLRRGDSPGVYARCPSSFPPPILPESVSPGPAFQPGLDCRHHSGVALFSLARDFLLQACRVFGRSLVGICF